MASDLHTGAKPGGPDDRLQWFDLTVKWAPPRRPAQAGLVFGVPLNELLGRERATLPRIITSIIEWLEDTRGIETRDIFRAEPGSQDDVDRLMTQFDLGRPFDFSTHCWDPLVAARVLKNYILALPDPLVPTALSQALWDCVAEADRGYSDGLPALLGKCLKTLPSSYKTLLCTLLLFLHRVSEVADVNIMHATDLGQVFGPLLMMGRDSQTARVAEVLIADAPAVVDVVTESELPALLDGHPRLNDMQMLFQEKWSRRIRRALRRDARSRRERNLVPRLRTKVDSLTRERNELRSSLDTLAHARLHDVEDLEMQVHAASTKLAAANARIARLENELATRAAAPAPEEPPLSPSGGEHSGAAGGSDGHSVFSGSPSTGGGGGPSSGQAVAARAALLSQLEAARLGLASAQAENEQIRREHALLTRAKLDLSHANEKLKAELQEVKIAKSTLALQRRQLEFQVTKLNHIVKESGGQAISLDMLLAAAANGHGSSAPDSPAGAASPRGALVGAHDTAGRLRVASTKDEELRVLRITLSQEQTAHAKARQRITLLHDEIKAMSAQILSLRRKLARAKRSSPAPVQADPAPSSPRNGHSPLPTSKTQDELNIRHLQVLLDEARADNNRLAKVCLVNNDRIRDLVALNKKLKKKCAALIAALREAEDAAAATAAADSGSGDSHPIMSRSNSHHMSRSNSRHLSRSNSRVVSEDGNGSAGSGFLSPSASAAGSGPSHTVDE
ncbi:uncharacterized protein AMSG_04664 [Thecamonas trahens ATCC 50062]|uniref:Rho-GAP domain-containing protein n=1 Tax=Thecamonas trahens ATCC 50062 TaxID=461836 RepID=A0A0L0D998_THETB|nr:hypothetical protein AMSG_04664 [Thecamonas trahens ATCC 50062]KNC48919.1 hypothetical protein AMSG_04664 [Thecamonas trahens ATCC 50062]|eukprot:XP_013758336.1 hypothetical protein AMSG_04664 [Thecamonas trahens ATCC 50062]